MPRTKTDFAPDASASKPRFFWSASPTGGCWRPATPRGIATFKTNVGKAQQQIAELEKADLPPNLAALLATVKTGVAKYAEAFDKTGPNLVLGDELYYKAITPADHRAPSENSSRLKESIGKRFDKTTAETERPHQHHRSPCRKSWPAPP